MKKLRITLTMIILGFLASPVQAQELPSLLEKGWFYVRVLSGGHEPPQPTFFTDEEMTKMLRYIKANKGDQRAMISLGDRIRKSGKQIPPDYTRKLKKAYE